MRKALSAGLTLALALPVFAAKDEKRPPTEQIQRGHDLFVKSAKGTACATCHELAGEGTAVGPDLKTMGSMGTPHVIVMTMRMTMTNYVQSFKTVHGGTFPGMLKGKQNDETEVWDLSKIPPVLRKLPNSEIVSMERDQTWKHPPASVEYTPQELVDLISFLRWAATGDAKEMKAAEVADMQ
ncbi:MAG TPA: c-type cytochrome [Bryobacteraceae bacterium]|nr:c-type cytochrome [Bryobacteraceae bacterium]